MQVSLKSSAGRLKDFVSHWKCLTNSKLLLQWIEGYKIPFNKKPVQRVIRHQAPNESDLSDTNKHIHDLLVQGVIEKCHPTEGQFLSPFFLVKKSSGKIRFILNLKTLNSFIAPPHFKMEDARTVCKLIQTNCFMATIDLTNAYYMIPIHSSHKKFLRFMFGNILYQFTCLPFGLSVAPFTFSKLIKPIILTLRKKGITCVAYLDDFIIFGRTAEDCLKNVQYVLECLSSLGFIINVSKSSLLPSQRCKYLGFIFDSTRMTIELSYEQKSILGNIDLILHKRKLKIRDFAQLVGRLVSACPATKYGWLYVKHFEREIYLHLRRCSQNYNGILSISDCCKKELMWWKTNILTAFNNLQQPEFTFEIHTDASLTGWGAVCGDKTVFGLSHQFP